MTFQILALSGGGYRGLFTANVLAQLERQAKRPIGDCFDLIAGTSIGGIIALGLVMGKRAETILKVFLEKGETIFPLGEPPRRFWQKQAARLRQWRGPKYDGSELRKAVEAVIGNDTLIRDAKTRLLIPAVNMTKGSVQMFKTAHHPSLVVDKDRKAVDVGMATSAAPFFFPMATIGDSYFVDGGLVANAPDMCAIHEAIHFLDQKIEDLRVLSIGTTTTKFSLPASLGGNFGQSDWLRNQRIISTVFSVQQQHVDFMVRHRLGDRYIRVDDVPSAEQCVDLGLDLATAERRQTLLGMAEGAYQKVAGDSLLNKMLAHQPTQPKFYN